MSQTHDHELPEDTDVEPSASGSSHRGLVLGAAVLATGATIGAGWYGLRAGTAGAVVFKALALEGAMVALAAWLALHAFRIRERLEDARDWEPQDWDDADEHDEDVTLQDVQHSRKIHYLVLAAPATVIVGLLATLLVWNRLGSDAVVHADHMATMAVISLVACCLWLVLSRSFEAAGKEGLPEGPALMLAFRELQWVTLLVAVGVVGASVWPDKASWGDQKPWPPPEIWVTGIALVWLLAVCVEQLIRLTVAWLHQAPIEKGFTSPSYLLAREAVFVRGNPIASIFETIEARFGVSFRSSWAIRFVRAAAVPALIAVVLLFWGLSGLSIVETDHWGVRESFGRVEASHLPPGLHWKVPWPFGRIRQYPVRQVMTMPVGFEAAVGVRQKAYLWTKAHAAEEHPFVLGKNGSEAVSVGAVVYYKISEDPERFLHYAVQEWSWQSTDEGEETRAEADKALRAYAYRGLMEATQSSTLQEVLATDRQQFADRLEKELQAFSEEKRLGLEVVDVAVLMIHPPIDVAGEFLDVISAEIDAKRVEIEAQGQKRFDLTNAETKSQTIVAQAKVFASQEVGKATEESAEFLAIRQAYTAAPDTFKLQLWFNVLERTLGQTQPETFEQAAGLKPDNTREETQPARQIIVVDETVAAGPGEVLIDLRPDAQKRDVAPIGVP